MRIALLTGEYPPQPGGIGDYTQQLAWALARLGHQVAVITHQNQQLLLYLPVVDQPDRRPVDAPVVIIRNTHYRDAHAWSHRSWPSLIQALDYWRPDWLHIQYQTGAFGMQAGINFLPWRLRGLVSRPKIAVTFHDLLVPYLFPKAGLLRGWVNRRLAADADAVVATNSADVQQLQRMLAQHTLAHIPIGSNIPTAPPSGYSSESWRAQLGISADTFLVAYFGLFSANKGIDTLLDALTQLGQRLNWQLVLIGGAATSPQDQAYAATLRARLEQPDLAERVRVTGHVDAQEVSAHLLAADCVALPFRDGASFRRGSLMAALAHGCAIVTTTPGDLASTEALQGAALFTPPDETEALAAALIRLADDIGLRNELSAAAIRAAEPFSWDRIAQQHIRLYADL